jgi:hypothetical protein
MSVLHIEKSRMKTFKSLCSTYSLKEGFIDVLDKNTAEHQKFTFVVNVDQKKETQAIK